MKNIYFKNSTFAGNSDRLVGVGHVRPGLVVPGEERLRGDLGQDLWGAGQGPGRCGWFWKKNIFQKKLPLKWVFSLDFEIIEAWDEIAHFIESFSAPAYNIERLNVFQL